MFITDVLTADYLAAAMHLQRDPRTCRAASHAQHALRRLLETAGAELLALHATQTAATGQHPAELLEALAQRLQAARDEAIAAGRAAAEARRAHMDRIGPALRQAFQQHEEAQAELQRLQNRLATARTERTANAQKLRDAGLTEQQIAGLELAPTEADLSDLAHRAHVLRAEIDALQRFVSNPRAESLGGIALRGIDLRTLQPA